MAANEPVDSLLDLLPIREDDHVEGAADAPVTLVEFGDYECPACAEAYVTIQRLEKDFGGKLKFVFRHFPYAKLHPKAELAAQAAEAASAQGKFWEMHRLLFENPDALDFGDLVAHAEKLQLDVPRFEEDLRSERFLDRVRSDFRTGVQNGVFGTPGIFLNGIRHNGDTDYDTLHEAIEQSLEEATQQSGA